MPAPLTGTFTADPLLEQALGARLDIQALLFPLTIEPDSRAYYQGALLQMHWRTNSEEIVDGSAAMVAPGVIIAARHVIENQNRRQRVMAGEMSVWLSATSALANSRATRFRRADNGRRLSIATASCSRL